MLHFAAPLPRPPAAEPPALVRVVSRNDVQWNRPIFKAPPLAVPTPRFPSSQPNAGSVGTRRFFR